MKVIERALLPVVLVCLLALVGCGDDDTDDLAPAATTTVSTTSTTRPASTTTDGSTTTSSSLPGGFDGATTPTSASAPADTIGAALLTDVRVSTHDGFDRVVFEFRDQLPGFDVAYADGPVRQDGSGEVVEVEGDGVLVVRMVPASGVDLGGAGFEETYTGPDRLTGGTEVITEVVRIGDFEANLTWAIGADRQVPYRVERLTGPPRVVVDLSTS